MAKLSGVQYSQNNEDILLGGLLFACCNSDSDLSCIRFDIKLLMHEIQEFMTDDRKFVSFQHAKTAFCRTAQERVYLYCLCRTPWLEGTTSKAIYGENQKAFDSHVCVNCGNWFHNYCLSVCSLDIPKRNHDYICPECQVPPTIPWLHPKYTNTCTSDNFLTILFLHCQQHKDFLSKLGSSDGENAIRAGITAMLHGNITRGKTIVLEYIQSGVCLNHADNSNKYDCFGSEYAMCLQLFKHIWKISLTLKCNSPFCPNPNSQRFPVSFSLQPSKNTPLVDQIMAQFPQDGQMNTGYCGAEFQHNPPEMARYALNDREDVVSKRRVKFYECRGALVVQSGHFLSRSPWMIPLIISSFKPDRIKDMRILLPMNITVYGKTYCLAGYSMHKSGHFTAIVMWRGRMHFYDGLFQTDELRLKIDNNDDIYDEQDGSFVFYFLQ